MVIEFPATRKDNAFVMSDRGPIEQGRQEVADWLSESGYEGSDPNCVFAIFDDGEVVREWNVVEKPRRIR